VTIRNAPTAVGEENKDSKKSSNRNPKMTAGIVPIMMAHPRRLLASANRPPGALLQGPACPRLRKKPLMMAIQSRQKYARTAARVPQ